MIPRLRHFYRRSESIAIDGFQCITVFRVCSEGLSHIVKMQLLELDSLLLKNVGCKSIDECRDYEEFNEIEIEINRIQDLAVKVRIVTPRCRCVTLFIESYSLSRDTAYLN